MAEAFEYFNDEWNKEKTTDSSTNIPGMEDSSSSSSPSSE
jgi:hypothetical protein